MPKYSKAKLNSYLGVAANPVATTAQRGKALEDLACYLFEKFPGIAHTRRNVLNQFVTEEMDVAFWNNVGTGNDLSFLGKIILVECKNWSNAVGSQELAYFATRVRHRGNPIGILIAANGITGNPADRTNAHHILEFELAQGHQILVVTAAQLQQISSTDDLVATLQKRMCELVVAGTAFD
jgi:hypothetical protein